jgi:predicted dehydrogenase
MYKIGIIGLGRMASLFEEDVLMKRPCTHAGAYAHIKKTKIIAGCDIRKDRLNKFSKMWGVKSLYEDYKKMLKNEDLDIVSLCTHAQDRYEMTIDVAESGVKAIFCEKPFSTNLKNAEKIIKVCNKNDVILYVDHTRRWDLGWKTVKKIIEADEIGDIKVLNGFSTAGLLNGGTHLFDILRFYNGDVDWIDAKLKRDESTDPNGSGFIKFKNSSFGFIDVDFRDYVLFGLDIVGSKGMIKCGGMIRGDKNFELWGSMPSPTQTGLLELKQKEFPVVNGEMPLVNAINDIIESIENGKPPLCSGEDGRAALEIALAFHESDRLNKKIKLPLRNKKLTVIPRETSFTKDGKLRC